MDDMFSKYHPATNLIFFAGAIILGMCFTHPAFLCVSVFASALYYLLLFGRKGLRTLGGLLLLLLVIALINPLLNTRGDSVLFFVLPGRPFTLEALCYGLATGAVFVSVLLWFGCFNEVMTQDRLVFLFGGCAPALSLLLGMVLRLVPGFQAKAADIITARKCVGKAPTGAGKLVMVRNSMDILGALTAWALEGAVVTADSMRSRGYSGGRRSCFSTFRFSHGDRGVCAVMLLSMALTVVCAALGGAESAYFPGLSLWGGGTATALGCFGYGVFSR